MSGTNTISWSDDEQYLRLAMYMSALTTSSDIPTPAPTSNTPTLDPPTKPLSKNALKKLAKGKGKVKKEKKEWNTAKPKKDTKKSNAVNLPAFVNTTPKGEKKDLSLDMAPSYRPEAVEASWQDWWEAQGYFSCSDATIQAAKPDERFVMIIPPPNVTGSLHLGHALTVSIQDSLTRWHRMQGHATCWIPGTDHAGIATQSVVEKRLWKEEQLTRHDLGRDDFLKRVWEWKSQYESRIHLQLRSVGCSVDWTRTYFSMDDKCSRAVNRCFTTLWDKGLIYRATRMINWSCKLKTALSDIEVDYIDLEKRTKMAVPGHDKFYEFGVLTSFGYKVEGAEAHEPQLIVATTRLETMLGDSAVAVHPEDPRYRHLHGKYVIHPFDGRRIPIICDGTLVDMAFGTGAVKITPAHDPNDYECGKRHNLEFITVISDDGAICGTSKFEGMMRYDARVAIEHALSEMGQYHGKVDNKMRLGVCSRSGDIIEPLIKPQWFISCDTMARDAMDAVTSGELTIEPKQHEKTWFRWLENIRDWCISRQLWWGHRIPAYYATVKNEAYVDPNSESGAARWFAGEDESDARAKAAKQLNVDPSMIELAQDEDVLDTWVSAGLFPFAVFGWPWDNNNKEEASFYPTDFLETGYDILFFWVARMVFMGQALTGKLPFHTVYLHSMVRDKYGRKMSKSLGNVVDPLEIISGCALKTLHEKLEGGNLPPKEIEKAKKGQTLDFPQGIPECGADALRFGLLAYTQQGRDINLDVNRLVGYRNFCNKLWNATRFALSHFGLDFVPPVTQSLSLSSMGSSTSKSKRDQFILHRLNCAIASTSGALAKCNFGEATTAMYNFWLYDLCDVYLELLKPVMSLESGSLEKCQAQETLYYCLDYGLRLLHPFMPFVTEELWQRLPGKSQLSTSLTITSYPVVERAWTDYAHMDAHMDVVKSTVHAGRSIRAQYGLLNSATPEFYIQCASRLDADVLMAQQDDFCTLTRAKSVQVLLQDEGEKQPPMGCAMQSVNADIQVYVQLRGLVDFENEIEKMKKLVAKLETSIHALEKKRAKDDYLTKVPEKVRTADTLKMENLVKEKQTMDTAMENFEKLK